MNNDWKKPYFIKWCEATDCSECVFCPKDGSLDGDYCYETFLELPSFVQENIMRMVGYEPEKQTTEKNLLSVFDRLCLQMEDCVGCPYYNEAISQENCKRKFSSLPIEAQIKFVNEMAGE